MICPNCNNEATRDRASVFIIGRDYPVFVCIPCEFIVNEGRDGNPTGELVHIDTYHRRRAMFTRMSKLRDEYAVQWSTILATAIKRLDLPEDFELKTATYEQADAIVRWAEEQL